MTTELTPRHIVRVMCTRCGRSTRDYALEAFSKILKRFEEECPPPEGQRKIFAYFCEPCEARALNEHQGFHSLEQGR